MRNTRLINFLATRGAEKMAAEWSLQLGQIGEERLTLKGVPTR